jgi:EAL domain-containing protein (putative c-di-GMP-specific phosphodiesterase class I)
MRDGQERATPSCGGADSESAAPSLAHAAEELVRASGGSSLRWEGASLTTHFQPIYCVRRAACLGFEALVRVSDVSGAKVSPDELFARAPERSRSLLDWTCRALHLRNYATVDPGDRTLFINVHPEAAVRDARRGREFGELIRYYGLVPKRVCVEILEAPCSSEKLLRGAVDAYRDLGVSIAMDAFGVGCSNLDRIVALRPDVVKIDRSILLGAVGNDKARRMIPGIIALLREFHCKVAVEGIESRAAALLAIEAKADYLQGSFFAGPQSRLTEEFDGTALLDNLLRPSSGPNLAA